MIYLLIYLLVGLIYAGLTFDKTLKFIIKSNFDEDDLKTIEDDREKDEVKKMLASIFLLNVGITLFKVPFYPIIVLTKLGRKKNV